MGYKIMEWLSASIWAEAIHRAVETDEEKAAYNEAMDEVVMLCEKVLAECTIDDTRHSAIQRLCFIYSERGEKEKALALAHLRKAAEHAIPYEETFNENSEYTCLLFRGLHGGKISYHSPYNESHSLLESMKNAALDAIRDTAEFKAIESELQKHAGLRE